MKILIATDGSEFSKRAVEFCRNIISDAENTSIKIVSAVERPLPIAAEPFAVSAEYYNQLEEIERKNAGEFARQAETQMRSFFPSVSLDIETQILSGAAQRVVVEEAEKWGADLIVVGSHGYGFWSRGLLGSVSSAIVHHAPCSVLIVRGEGK